MQKRQHAPYPRFAVANAVAHTLCPATEVVVSSVKYRHLRVAEFFFELAQLIEPCFKVILQGKCETKRPTRDAKNNIKCEYKGYPSKIELAMMCKNANTYSFMICSSFMSNDSTKGNRYIRRERNEIKHKYESCLVTCRSP